MDSQVSFVEESIAESIEMQKNEVLHGGIDDEDVDDLLRYAGLDAVDEASTQESS